MADELRNLRERLRAWGAETASIREAVEEAVAQAATASRKAEDALGERITGFASELSTLEAWTGPKIDLEPVEEARRRALAVLTAASKILGAE